MTGRRVGAATLGVIVFAVIAAPLVTAFGWEEQHLTEQYLPPGSASHLLGTDATGRDGRWRPASTSIACGPAPTPRPAA